MHKCTVDDRQPEIRRGQADPGGHQHVARGEEGGDTVLAAVTADAGNIYALRSAFDSSVVYK